MKIRQIQFNYQQLAALLFAGLILALAAGLAWIGADISGSISQPVKQVLHGLYFPQSNAIGPSAEVVYPIIGKGSKLGGSTEGASFKGCESQLQPWSQLRTVKGGKGGVTGGDIHK